MRRPEIQKLVDGVDARHGPITILSDEAEEDGVWFTVEGVPFSFSVFIAEEELPRIRFDLQIEDIPPGDYLYIPPQTMSHEDVLSLVAEFKRAKGLWPDTIA